VKLCGAWLLRLEISIPRVRVNRLTLSSDYAKLLVITIITTVGTL
jgi:hypothetical protein